MMRLAEASRRTTRLGCATLFAAFVGVSPAQAHHATIRSDGATIGVVIPAISHGQMPVIAKYRAEIMISPKGSRAQTRRFAVCRVL